MRRKKVGGNCLAAGTFCAQLATRFAIYLSLSLLQFFCVCDYLYRCQSTSWTTSDETTYYMSNGYSSDQHKAHTKHTHETHTRGTHETHTLKHTLDHDSLDTLRHAFKSEFEAFVRNHYFFGVGSSAGSTTVTHKSECTHLLEYKPRTLQGREKLQFRVDRQAQATRLHNIYLNTNFSVFQRDGEGERETERDREGEQTDCIASSKLSYKQVRKLQLNVFDCYIPYLLLRLLK